MGENEREEALRGVTADDLTEGRRLTEGLLAQLERSGSPARPVSPGVVERRRFGRYALNVPVTYFRHRDSATGKLLGTAVQEAIVRDISRGGVRFFASEALDAGEVLTFYVPGPLGVRKLFVEIIHVEPRGGQFECGASFVGLDRVFAAQRVEDSRSETVHALLVGEPCPERDALAELLTKQGYTVHVANGVPDACAALSQEARGVVLATGPMLLAEGGRLANELNARRDDVLSIAIVSTSDIDQPESEPLRACHDFISEPGRAQEVRVVLGRTYRRLVAARARQARA